MRNDVAGKTMVMRTLAERHLRRNGAGEILLGDTLQPVVHVLAQCFARVYLMTRNADIHIVLLN
jgi:hypothetical protein